MKQIEGSIEEPYVSEVQSEVARLRNDHKIFIRERFIYLGLYFVIMTMVFLWIEFEEIVPKFIILIISTGILFFYVGSQIKNWLANSILVCPNCEAEVITSLAWLCGWCSNKNKSEDQYIFNGCGHKTCKQKPNAVRCPDCGKDIVLRERSYNRERNNSARRVAGVARFVGLPDKFKFFITWLPISFSENSKVKLLIEKQVEDDLDKDIG